MLVQFRFHGDKTLPDKIRLTRTALAEFSYQSPDRHGSTIQIRQMDNDAFCGFVTEHFRQAALELLGHALNVSYEGLRHRLLLRHNLI
jgi:hypothetical protein